jgi:PilZ domain
MTAEKRSAPRTRAFLKGKAIFNNRQSTLDCLVRDISATGARLEVSNAVLLPDAFDLYVAQKDTTMRARITWRRDGEIGVEFDQPHAAPAPALDLPARVQRLEAELGLQRMLIAQLRTELDGLRGRSAPEAVAG